MCEKIADESISAHNEFLRRIFALPVMADAYGQLSSFYSGTKERSRLLKLTMETAESGVGVLVSSAQPVLSKFDKQVLMLNNIACTQLDWLENSYPIITKPTDDVVKETKDRCTGAVQPVVNYVNSVKDYGHRKVSGIRTYTSDRIEGIRQYGADTVAAATKVGTDQVTRVLSTQVCREVLNKFDAALDIADRCVDNYLPESNEAVESKKIKEADIVVLSKAYQVGSKVQRRLYARAAKRLEKVQLQARENIAKLTLVLDWIELTKSNVSGAKEKAWRTWQEIMKMEDQVVQDATKEEIAYYDSTFDRRAIATARQLMMQLKGIVSWVDAAALSPIRRVPGTVQEKLHSSVALFQTLPASLRERVTGLGKTVHSLSEAFSKETINVREIPQSVLDNAKSTLHQLYDSLTDLVDWTLKNTSGYHKIEQYFHKSDLNSEKSSTSTLSDESETEKGNEKPCDKDDGEKGQKEGSKDDAFDNETPNHNVDDEKKEFEDENRVDEKNKEDASSDQHNDDKANEQKNDSDVTSDKQNGEVDKDENEEKGTNQE